VPDFFEDEFGGGSPLEWPRILVVVVQVVSDCSFQLTDIAKRSASDAFVGDLGKEAFDLIEP